MSKTPRGSVTPGRYASPPCLACEIAPDYFDPLAVDPEQARDVARWRKAERARLLAQRRMLGTTARRAASAAIAGHLHGFLLDRFGPLRGRVLAAYWPIKGEPDLRPLLAELDEAGVLLALPVVETRAAPLVFRRWTPRTRMVPGFWSIPVPPPDAPALNPSITLAPLLGGDGDGYRLGYGGGYFDRTLAALAPRPFTLGVGLQGAMLATIFPQPHDVRLDAIVTEAGVRLPPEAA